MLCVANPEDRQWFSPCLIAAGWALLSLAGFYRYSVSRSKLHDREVRLRRALDLGRMGGWERDLRTSHIAWDERTYGIYGIRQNQLVDGKFFIAKVDTADIATISLNVEATE